MIKAVMIDADPLEDVEVFKSVSWVMKGGREIPFADEHDRLAGKAPWLG